MYQHGMQRRAVRAVSPISGSSGQCVIQGRSSGRHAVLRRPQATNAHGYSPGLYGAAYGSPSPSRQPSRRRHYAPPPRFGEFGLDENDEIHDETPQGAPRDDEDELGPDGKPKKKRRKFQKYSLKMIGASGVMLAIGGPGSGKSTFITRLVMSKRQTCDLVLGYNPSEPGSNTLGPFTPVLLKHMSFDAQDKKDLMAILDFLKKSVEANKRTGQRWGIDDPEKLPEHMREFFRVILILDDCLGEGSGLNCAAMKSISFNHRHLKVLCIIAAQYVMDIPTFVRDFMWYRAFWYDPDEKNQRKMYYQAACFFGADEYGFKKFQKYYLLATFGKSIPGTKDYTMKYHALIFDKTQPMIDQDAFNIMYIYKASPVDHTFTIGNEMMYYLSWYYELEDYNHYREVIDKMQQENEVHQTVKDLKAHLKGHGRGEVDDDEEIIMPTFREGKKISAQDFARIKDQKQRQLRHRQKHGLPSGVVRRGNQIRMDARTAQQLARGQQARRSPPQSGHQPRSRPPMRGTRVRSKKPKSSWNIKDPMQVAAVLPPPSSHFFARRMG